MGFYASNISTPHRTLTEGEQRQLLSVTSERRDGFRDHVLYSMALATGLREHELAALEVSDVFEGDGRTKKRIVKHGSLHRPNQGLRSRPCQTSESLEQGTSEVRSRGWR